MHYSELDAGESYFKAVLSNTKEKTKVVSKRKFFQSKKYATTNSPEAAWKYEYLSAYLAQWFWSYRIKIDYRDNYSLKIELQEGNPWTVLWLIQIRLKENGM